ncbi:MAG: glycosyltransferase family 8 protein [Gilliamella sp.]|uniref:glycosyltransferase family 8 protein n=1 Tax=Gilliamella sp. TaxID=1891236 RepID=UPI0025E80EF3|nr:glycosyltransferase family 8 protein [Gilliamella sp.]MCO6539475.1 glycosyltransferase family 8 protein [Gilliamella sp.]
MNDKKDSINIAFCSDRNYLKYVAIAIQSIYFNNLNNSLKFHVFLYDVSQEDIDKLNRMYLNISVYSIPEGFLDKYDNEYAIKHLNRSMYIRLLVPRLLKEKVDKLIYLDADILCFKDISAINNINIDNVVCAASVDSLNKENIKNNVQRLNLSTSNYFNSGFLYINVKKWNDFHTEEKINNILLEHRKQLLYPDQDALNIVLQNNVLIIDHDWNYLFTWISEKDQNKFLKTEKKIPYFIHFTGARKPWYLEHLGMAQDWYVFYKHFTSWRSCPLESYKDKMRISDYRIYAKRFLKQGRVFETIKYAFLYLKLKLKNNINDNEIKR